MRKCAYFKLFILFVLLVVASCKGNDSDRNKHSIEVVNDSTALSGDLYQPEPLMASDIRFNQTAFFLSGIKQQDSCVFSEYENKEFWKYHASEMDKLWEKATDLRLNKISDWRNSTFKNIINDTLPLFYPFAGGDFIHAWSFYPEASAYHLIAMEGIKLLPDFKSMDEKALIAYLTSLRSSLRDVIGKSYFITKHMITDLKEGDYAGLLPLYHVFLARTGHQILNIEPIRLDTNGRHVVDSLSYHGVRIQTTFDGYQEKTLTYLKFDLSDKNINNSTYFKSWVNSLGEKNVFLKAASYLPHYNSFQEIRKLMFEGTSSIFQDDSGIAYRYVDTTKFDVKIFGRYTTPIKDFSEHTYQKDLANLYERTPASERPEIPFSLGYHVVGDKIQNHQLFIRLD